MNAGNATLRDEIDALGPWFHNLHLPDGTQTAPGHRLGDFPSFKWRNVAHALPADLAGWTALDIGCNAGFYSFEMARRGAQVTGIDVEPLYLDQARWAAKRYGLHDKVEFLHGHVYGLRRLQRRYDLVWFTGVLYHLRYPLLALDIVRSLAGRLVMFQTLTVPGMEVADVPPDLPLDDRHAMRAAGWPRLAFIEHRLAGDETNWWAPNHACVEAMLRSSGFEVIARPEHEFYLCRPVTWSKPKDFERLDESLGN